MIKTNLFTDNGNHSPAQISTRSISPSIANNNSIGQIQSTPQPTQQQQVASQQQQTPSHLLVNNLVNLATPTQQVRGMNTDLEKNNVYNLF